MLRELRSLEGVRAVRLNAKAASVTVSYDIHETGSEQILEFLEAELMRLAPRRSRIGRTARKPATRGNRLTAEIGKMALSVLVNKSVSYSISSLLGARA